MFFDWKISKALLRVTIFAKGRTEEVLVNFRVCAIDPEAFLVGLASSEIMHSFRDYDVEGALFEVEACRVVATRGILDWIIFEEMLSPDVLD